MNEIERARALWRNRGQRRPEFADPTGPGQESVWDYPRPPRCVPDARRVRVLHGAITVVDSTRCVRVLETASPPTFYAPPEDTDRSLLIPGSGSSHCEWKGAARYWSLRIGDETLENVAWSYPDPYPEFSAIRDFLCFYPGRVECWVGDERVRPQPGGFYGGWITSEVVGPFKGEPGTGGW